MNTGIYILSPEIFSYYGKDRFFDFSRDLFPMLMKENRRMYGYITDEYWCDIGDINAYMQANFDAMDGKWKSICPVRKPCPVSGPERNDDRGAGQDRGPLHNRRRLLYKGGAVIGRHVVIGDNCIVEGNSSIKRSIIWKNSIIGEKAEIRGSVVCSRTVIESGASAFEGSVVGEGCRIGERTLIRPSVKIWPGKNVDRCMELCENLVWGSGAARHIFGNRGVTGTVNTDMTPEFAAKLGAAFAAAVKNRGIIGVCSDGTPAATMIRSALVSGLLSAGAHVNDYRKMLLPALRFAVRFCRLDGGIYAGTCGGSVKRLSLDFIDSAGRSIDRSLERKIESLFCRDDFGR